MAAGEEADQSLGPALDRIAASLSPPLSGGEIGGDLVFREPLENDDAGRKAVMRAAARVDQGDGGEDAVAAAGEKGQRRARLGLVLGLGKNAAAHGDDRVG